MNIPLNPDRLSWKWISQWRPKSIRVAEHYKIYSWSSNTIKRIIEFSLCRVTAVRYSWKQYKVKNTYLAFIILKCMHEYMQLGNMPTYRLIAKREWRLLLILALGNPSKVMSKSVLTSEISHGFRASWSRGAKFTHKDSPTELILPIISKARGKIIRVELGPVSKNNSRGFTLRIRLTVEINFLTLYVLLLYAL